MGEKYLKRLPGVERVDSMLVDVVPFEKPYLPAVYVLGWSPDSPMLDDLRMTGGRKLQQGDKWPVLLGSLLANSLQKHVGDKVRIEGADWEVVGIYESYNMFENGAAIVKLSDLQERMGKEDKATTFLVKLADGPNKNASIDQLCRQIEDLKNEKGESLGIIAKPTQDHIKSNLELRVAEAMSWATSAIALIIGVIGMLNTMMMSVFERTREIGTLRAVGWRRAPHRAHDPAGDAGPVLRGGGDRPADVGRVDQPTQPPASLQHADPQDRSGNRSWSRDRCWPSLPPCWAASTRPSRPPTFCRPRPFVVTNACEPDILLSAKDLCRTYPDGDVQALQSVNIEIRRGEYVAIMGPSGSGKSTLLNLLGALDRPDSGEIYFAGQPLSRLPTWTASARSKSASSSSRSFSCRR